MKSVASIAALTLLALAGSDVLTGELATAPTALERFVARSSVVLDLEEDVGSLHSSNATVTIAAVIGTDRARPAERMRGVRFTLEDNGGIDLAYLDIAELQALLADLDGIEGGVPDLKAEGGAPWRVQGTGSCWMPKEPMRILCPNFHVGPEGSGFGLAVYGSRGFEFPDRRPGEFAALIELALARLEGP